MNLKSITKSAAKLAVGAALTTGFAANAVAEEAEVWTYNTSTKVLTDGNWLLKANNSTGKLTISAFTSVTDGTVLNLRKPVVKDGDPSTTYVIVSPGEKIFRGRTTLKELYLPDTITTLGADAFKGDTGLVHVEPFLPASVKSISSTAFLSCPVTNDLFLSCPELTSIPHPGSDSGTFRGFQSRVVDCSKSGITSIGQGAFYSNSKLERVYLPKTLTRIYVKAFYNATALIDISFLSCPTNLDGNAFQGAMGLPGRMTFPAADAGWTEKIDAAKTAGTFTTWKGATQAQRDAYLAKFDASPKPLGYMNIGGKNRWMVPIGEGFSVIFR